MADAGPPEISKEGFTVLFEAEDVKADIVFVHGLQGNPYTTWAYAIKPDNAKTPEVQEQSRRRDRLFRPFGRKTVPEDHIITHEASTKPANQDAPKVYWPKDCLAAEEWCKSARILTYGYDTSITKGYAASNKNNLFAHAKSLLYDLERTKPSGRPIIFLVHSLGGILVKETLRRSEESKEENIKDIVQSTKGIIFLGTPHRGSPGLASLGETVRKVASVVARVDSNSSILRSLGTDSPELELGRESFVELWQTYKFRVKTFQEAYGLSGINVGRANDKVVFDTSSSLDDRKEHTETISANHMDMARFHSPSDDGYKKVSSEVKVMLSLCSQDILKCLRFQGIDDGLQNISRPWRRTTDWLFATSNYRSWVDGTDASKNHGLLWIKGKPGAGKSTLMKAAFIREKSISKASNTSTAAFFFNARSTQPLEKSPMGLYRSLLFQVLEQDPDIFSQLSDKFESKVRFDRDETTGHINGHVEWYQEELQGYLEKALKTPESKPAILFIDAIDECDDKTVHDLVDYFNRLTHEASQLGAKLRVCLSSRHYPQISIDGCHEIVVEEHNGPDILRYIEARVGNDLAIKDLSQDIAKKSGGIFLWVVLVVDCLKRSARGKSLKWLRNKLNETPSELTDLFKQLFSDVDEKDLQRTTNLMFLILFAREPLNRAGLHTALGFSLHAYPSLRAWKDSDEYLESSKSQHEMIIELSKGVLEPILARLQNGYGRPRKVPETSYQFIHETVREFFLSGEGFRLLKFHTHSVVGSGHNALAWACAHFLNTEDEPGKVFSQGSFESYALFQLFYHIENSAAFGDFGESILKYLHTHDVLARRDVVNDNNSNISPNAGLMYIAAETGSLNVAMKLHHMGFDVNSKEDTLYSYPLLAAIVQPYATAIDDTSKSRARMVKWLLNNGANVNVCDKSYQTAIHLASRFGTPDVVKEILGYNPNINAQDFMGRVPLYMAIYNEFAEDIARLLITHGADVHAVDNFGNSPLSHPCLSPGVAQVLIEAGCPLNKTNQRGDTALHTMVVESMSGPLRRRLAAPYNYLVEAGTDVTIRNKEGYTAGELLQRIGYKTDYTTDSEDEWVSVD
ncbi:hypothetical protein F4859DRAFT_131587 [Xylaria cf. heliscus]|nr:hypothetical protein F4859DRAFT_131587 [Xylaria cf. heliscus]